MYHFLGNCNNKAIKTAYCERYSHYALKRFSGVAGMILKQNYYSPNPRDAVVYQDDATDINPDFDLEYRLMSIININIKIRISIITKINSNTNKYISLDVNSNTNIHIYLDANPNTNIDIYNDTNLD